MIGENTIFTLSILTISDAGSRGERADTSGDAISEVMAAAGFEEIARDIIADERELIARRLADLCDAGDVDLVVTTGGTGLGPRDVTPEATRQVIDLEVPGIAEAMRMHGQRRTPYAMLSRGLVGLRGQTLIVNLPGSSRGAMESMDAIFPAVLHSFKMLHGDAR